MDKSLPFSTSHTGAIIRDAQPDDLPHIVSLWRETLKEHVNAESDYYQINDQALKFYFNMLYRIRDTPDHYLRVVVINEYVVAFLYGYMRYLPPVFKSDKQAYISDITVQKEFRSKGIGRLLLSDFANWAKKHFANSISLNVHVANASAIEFYEKLGLKKQMYVMRAPLSKILPHLDYDPDEIP